MTISGRSDRSIKPGQTEEVKINLTAKGHGGPFKTKVAVQTNDRDNRTVDLLCKGYTQVPFRAKPTLVSFGTLRRDMESQTKSVMITRGDAGPLALELAPIKGHPNVATQLREIEAGEQYELEVTINPPWPNLRISTQVLLKTGLEGAANEKIRVLASFEPRLKPDPAHFKLPRDSSAEVEKEVRLVWAGENPGKASSVRCTSSDLAVRLEDKQDGEQVVVLTIPPGYQAQPRRVQFVTVMTDDEQIPSLRIPVMNEVRRFPAARPPIVRPQPGKVAGQKIDRLGPPAPTSEAEPRPANPRKLPPPRTFRRPTPPTETPPAQTQPAKDKG